ncbi:midnolin-A [Parasteatoda tepidariorum]|uniref:midnolin-A n=1 Tax=Parasteatoda tepidariorum TaxID=114398 RepID=UPI001C721332|nr:midnolin-A [Parasteatoda tepidariorum]
MAEVDNRTFYVQPTTGGRIEVTLPSQCSVNNLKLALAKRLKVPRDKIILLHRNKQLTEGSLKDNNISEGSKLTLLPNVETGLVTQNPEQYVMQALETLNESQVDSFLNGRSPLNLSMRMGDHMMFIQLQLSTVHPSSSNNSGVTPPPTPPTTPTTTTAPPPFPLPSTVITSTTTVTSPPISPPPSPHTITPPSPFSPTGGSTSGEESSFSNHFLAEASRNLAHTLRHLSSKTLTKKMNETCNGRCCIARRHGGAVIESMYHHGKGVFSGTFSGTLSPLLQDREGRPRRNICTIVHILNDLLGASSHCNPSPKCTPHRTQTPHKELKEDVLREKEDKVLREKVQHIQSLLKEKRKGRRPTPYSTFNPESRRSGGLFFSTLEPSEEQPEQSIGTDYSSETAAA